MNSVQDDTFDPELFGHVYAAAGRPAVREAVASIYTNLQHEIDVRKPICNTSGRCCRFEEFGHRLYVTTVELAAFVYGLELQTIDRPADRKEWNGLGCPFQTNGLCGVHAIRPFGCRIFFCDETSTAWQHEQYERFHNELKRLHETLTVPYYYLEWRAALAAIGLANAVTGQSPL